MKLALVIPGGVDRSGQERVIPVLLWLIERLARQHTVHVFALHQYPDPCDYELLGAHIHNIGQPKSLPKLRLIQQYHQFIDRVKQTERQVGRFDCFHGFWAGSTGLFAGLAARRYHAPCLVSLMGGEVIALPEINYGMQCHWRSRLLVRWSTCLASQVTVATQYMQALANQHHIRSEIVPFGADRNIVIDDVPMLRTNSQKHLLHVASLNQVKDQPTLLRAMRRIVDTRSDVHLDIVGEDTLHGAMQRLCNELGLNGQVTFHGFRNQNDLRPFYQMADLLLLPSRHDAAPIVVLEAALHGVPTIGSAVGYVADWAPTRAQAIPIGDDVALAATTLTLLADDSERIRIGQYARDWAQTYDADWTAQQFEIRYRTLSTLNH